MDLSLFSEISTSDIVFILTGFFGMVCHYLKKLLRGETSSGFSGWFWKDNLNSTLNTLAAFSMAVITALNSGIITEHMSIWAVLYAGLTTGFAIDSGFNSGKQQSGGDHQ